MNKKKSRIRRGAALLMVIMLLFSDVMPAYASASHTDDESVITEAEAVNTDGDDSSAASEEITSDEAANTSDEELVFSDDEAESSDDEEAESSDDEEAVTSDDEEAVFSDDEEAVTSDDEEAVSSNEAEAVSENAIDTVSENELISVSENELEEFSAETMGTANGFVVYAYPNLEEDSKQRLSYKTFDTYAEAVSYIDAMNNPNLDAGIEIHASSSVDINGQLTIPKNVHSFTLSNDPSASGTRDVWYTGDITAATDVRFVNVKLKSADKAGSKTEKPVALKLNGRNVTFENASAKFTTINGDKAGNLLKLDNSTVEISGAVKLLGNLRLQRNSSLNVSGALEVNDIVNYIIKSGSASASASRIKTGSTFTVKGAVINIIETDGVSKIVNDSPLIIERTAFDSMAPVNGDIVIDDAVNVNIKAIVLYKGSTKYTTFSRNGKSIVYSSTEKKGSVKVSKYSAGAANWRTYCEEINGLSDISVSDRAPFTNEEVVAEVGYYNTLQDAFDVIDRLGTADEAYVVELLDNNATALNGSKTANISTPKNVGFVKIKGGSSKKTVYLNNTIDIRCNTYLENVSLSSYAASFAVKLNSNMLVIDKCTSVNECKFTGSGIDGTSMLINKSIDTGSIDKVAVVCIARDNAGSLTQVGSINAGRLYTKNICLFINGNINVKTLDLYAHSDLASKIGIVAIGDNTIGDINVSSNSTINLFVGVKTTTDSNGSVTSATPRTKVTGDITYSDTDSKICLYPCSISSLTARDIAFTFAPKSWFNMGTFNGVTEIPLVAAPKVIDIHGISMYFNDSNCLTFKRNGNIEGRRSSSSLNYNLYAMTDMDFESNNIINNDDTICQVGTYNTFTEAVNEINKIGIKQNYYIEVVNNKVSDEYITPLTMPNASCVNKLIIGSENNYTLKYTGSLSLTCDTMLRGVSLVQGTVGRNGTAVKFTESPAATYQTINVNGKKLYVSRQVSVNTYTKFDGKNGDLIINKDAGFSYKNTQKGINIAGSLTGFNTIKVSSGNITIGLGGAAKNEAATIETNVLDFRNNTSAGISLAGMGKATNNKLTVKKDLYINSGYYNICGSADLNNVTIGQAAAVEINVTDAFTIKGSLTNTNNNVTFITRVKEDKAGSIPMLNIQGQINTSSRICIKTFHPENSIKRGECIQYTLTDTVLNYKHTDVVLTAKYGNPNDFTLASENVISGYTRQEPSAGMPSGGYKNEDKKYALVKTGDTIRYQVLNGTAVVVLDKAKLNSSVNKADNNSITRFGSFSGNAVIGYYNSFNDATADIDKINNMNANYVIVLLRYTADAQGNPIAVKMPTKAASVEVVGYCDTSVDAMAKCSLFYSNDITLGTDTTFRNINLLPATKGKNGPEGKMLNINVGKYDLDMSNNVTVGKASGSSGSYRDDFWIKNFSNSKNSMLGSINGQAKSGNIVKLNNIDVNGNISNIGTLMLQGTQCTATTNGIYDCSRNVKGSVSGIDNIVVAGYDFEGTVNAKNASLEGTVLFRKSVTLTGDISVKSVTYNTKTCNVGQFLDTVTVGNIVNNSSEYRIWVNAGKLSCNNIQGLVTMTIQDKNLSALNITYDTKEKNRILLKGKELFKIKGKVDVDNFKIRYDSGSDIKSNNYSSMTVPYLVKSGGAMYSIDNKITGKSDCLYQNVVSVAVDGKIAGYYLDINSAFSDIPNISDANKDVVVNAMNVESGKFNHLDVDVSGDNNTHSAIKFPDESSQQVYKSLTLSVEYVSDDSTSIYVTDNVGVLYGNVTLDSVKFDKGSSSKGIAFALKPDKNNISKLNVKSSNLCIVKQITGTKGVSEIAVTGYLSGIAEASLKDISKLQVESTCRVYMTASNIENVVLNGGSEIWVNGKSTFGNVNINGEPTMHVAQDTSGIPMLTITGDFEAAQGSKLILRAAKSVTGGYADIDLYSGLKLVKAPKMDNSVVKLNNYTKGVYTDSAGYIVCKGSTTPVTVVNSKTGATYYCYSFNEASELIDSANDITAEYSITLATGDRYASTVKQNGKDVPGAIKMPTKAAKVVIIGNSASNTCILFSGKLDIKTNTVFKNIQLSEYVMKNNYVEALEKIDVSVANGKLLEFDNAGTGSNLLSLKQLNAAGGNLSVKTSGTQYEIKCDGKMTVNQIKSDTSLVFKTLGTTTVGRGGIDCKKTVSWFNFRSSKDVTKTVNSLTVNGPIKATGFTVCINKDDDSSMKKAEADKIINTDPKSPGEGAKLFTAPVASTVDIVFWEITPDGKKITNKAIMCNKGVYTYNGDIARETMPIIVVGHLKDFTTYNYYATWEQAVKSIDNADWYVEETTTAGKTVKTYAEYDIVLRYYLGSKNSPITSFNMPGKASKINIRSGIYKDGEVLYDNSNTIKIYTTATSVALNSDVYMDDKIYICSVKKSGTSNVVNDSMTVNAGSHTFEDTVNKRDPDCSKLNISGSATGKVVINCMNSDVDQIRKISGVGTVTINNKNELTPGKSSMHIADGITGVGELTVDKYVSIYTDDGDLSVKKLNVKDLNNIATGSDYANKITARNVTVSDTLSAEKIDKLYVISGIRSKGNGKITVNNVIFNSISSNGHIYLFGKQDSRNSTQISINGTFTCKVNNAASDSVNRLCIGLFANNYTDTSDNITKFPMSPVHEGMKLVNAPYVGSKAFNIMMDETVATGSGVQYCNYAGTNNSLYGTYKADKAIYAGRLYKDNAKTQPLYEAEVTASNYSSTYRTFEDAVKDIDNLNDNSKEYTIIVKKDIEIGNDKKDGAYNALVLPTKARILNIKSDPASGSIYTIRYKGDIILKSNTNVLNVLMESMVQTKVNGKSVAVPVSGNIIEGVYKYTMSIKL